MIQRLGVFSILFALLVAPVWAADVTGHWRVTISTPDGKITGFAAFKQNDQAVTGWVGPSEDDPIPITGVLKETSSPSRHFRNPAELQLLKSAR